jgi:hypothetical protein
MLCAALLAAAVPCMWSMADRAPSPPVVRSFSPDPDGKSDVVRMTWQEVDLYPSPERIRVEVVFGAKNAGSSAVEYEVGFPAYRGEILRDFTVEMDGVRKPTKRKDALKNARSARDFPYWICWQERFAAGQASTIKVSYWVAPAHASYRQWHQEGYTRWIGDGASRTRNALRSYYGRYTLQTGAAWAGTIGKAVIRIHYSDEVKKELTGIDTIRYATRTRGKRLRPRRTVRAAARPDAWVYDPATQTDSLTLRDFEPTPGSDIGFCFRRCTPQREAEMLTALLREKRLHPAVSQRLVNLLRSDGLGLGESEKRARLIEAREWLVTAASAPGWPDLGFKAQRWLDRSIRTSYAEAKAHYERTGRTHEALSLARRYLKYLERGRNTRYWRHAEEWRTVSAYLEERGGQPRRR